MSTLVPAMIAACSAALAVLGGGRIVQARRAVAAPRRRGPRAAGPIGRRPAGRRLAARLERGGIGVGADAFVSMTATAALAGAVLAVAVVRVPIAGVIAAGGIAGAAAVVVRSADRRRLARIEAQLPGVAQQLSAALAAGLSLRQALMRAARDAPEPVCGGLGAAVAELEMGTRLEAALEGLADRVPVHDLGIMVTAILVQRRTGGNLARALATLSGRLEERAQLARELRGATAQARMTAWLVAVLPVGAGLVTEIAAPGTLARTLGEGPGPAVLLAAGLLYAGGVVAIRRIGRVEP
jgi:tight adherence protein B